MDKWFMAVWMNDFETLQSLASTNLCRTDETGCTALMYAAKKGFTQCVPILQKEKGVRDKEGRTALMLAIVFQKIDVVPLLISEATIQDNDGWTAAMHAISQNDLISLEHVIEKELLLTNCNGQTILHLAVQMDSVDFVEYLVQHENLIEKKDNNGRTALLYAVQSGNEKNVQYLIKECGIKDECGICALKLAVQTKNKQICQILIPHELHCVEDYVKQELIQLGFDIQRNVEVDNDLGNTIKNKLEEQKEEDQISQNEIQKMMDQFGIVIKTDIIANVENAISKQSEVEDK